MSEIMQIGSAGGPTAVGLPEGEAVNGGFGDIVSGARELLSSGLQSISAYGGLQMPGELFGLIEIQRQLQIEMETVSMISNIEKSRHESRMAAVRNMRTN